MNTFVFWLSLALTSLVAALLITMPSLTRSTVPLGVSVPQARTGEPVIRRAILRYRLAAVGAWLVSIAVTVLLALTLPAAAAIIPVLVLVVLGGIAYLLSRRSIVRAKQDGQWYGSVRVRLTADITRETSRPKPVFGWSLAALIILLGTTAVGIALYPGLPDPLPTHWNAAGQVDGEAAKSIWSVFGPLLIGLAVLAALFGGSVAAQHAPVRLVAPVGGDDGRRRALAQRGLLVSLLGQIGVVMAIVLAWASTVEWSHSNVPELIPVGVVGMVVLIAVVLVVFVVRWRRLLRQSTGGSALPRAAGATTGDAADAPDDDRFWKGGMLYVNRDDPALFVPRRFGVGWTVNLGNAGGIALATLVILIVAAGIVVAAVVPGMAHAS